MTNLDLGKMFGDSNQEMQKAAALKTYLVKLDEILPSEENPYEVEEESVQRLAENIEQYGLFQALEDLMKVKGIGQAKFDFIKDKICL